MKHLKTQKKEKCMIGMEKMGQRWEEAMMIY